METQEISIIEISVALVFILLWVGSTIWANKLKGNYLDPYALQKATDQEKRKWAIQLTILQFGFLVPIAILIPAGLSSTGAEPLVKVAQWAFCLSGMVLVLVLVALWQYWKINNKLSTYQSWNIEKKRDKFTKTWLFSETGFLNSRVKERFWGKGYSDNEPDEDETR